MDIEIVPPLVLCTTCAGEGWVEEPEDGVCPRCKGSGEEPEHLRDLDKNKS